MVGGIYKLGNDSCQRHELARNFPLNPPRALRLHKADALEFDNPANLLPLPARLILQRQTRNDLSLVCKAVEPIGQDQQRGSPQSHKDTEPLGVRRGLRGFAIQKPPDPNGKNNGQQPTLETDGTQGATDMWIHIGEINGFVSM